MKRLKAVAAAALACVTMLSFTGCGGVKLIDDEDVFFDALENAVSIDKDETLHEKNAKLNGDKVEYYIYTGDGDNFYTYIRFKKADDAMDMFDEFYQDFEDVKEDKNFEGSYTMKEGKTSGSVIFNGKENSFHRRIPSRTIRPISNAITPQAIQSALVIFSILNRVLP